MGGELEQVKDIVLAECDSNEELEKASVLFLKLGLEVNETVFYFPKTESIQPGTSIDDVEEARYFLTTTQSEFKKHREVFEKVAPNVDHTGVIGSGAAKPALWDLV